MSNTIAHLAVANEIFKLISNKYNEIGKMK